MASSPTADNANGGASSSGRGRRLRRLLLLGKDGRQNPPPEQNPPSERNPLLASPLEDKKKSFASVAFRGLGCSSSSAAQVYTPAACAVRSSADWQAKRSRNKRKKSKAKRNDRDNQNQQAVPQRKNQMAAAEIWCAPGYAFADVADASVDCVVSQQRTMVVRGVRAADSERVQRERVCIAGRSSNQERLSSLLDSPESTQRTPLFGSDIMAQNHFRHSHGFCNSPGGFGEILLFQTRLLLDGVDAYDRYRDLRLDVDSMSYEELLALGDRIGYVNTGLREEEILRCLRKMKHSIFDVQPLQFSSEMESKCSICQEEYEVNDEVGKLECGHRYHVYCIKQWLLQKKVCPVCKSAVARN